MALRVNVVDPDVGRRARVSRELHIGDVHVEIYEDVNEFTESTAPTGVAFILDEDDGKLVEAIAEIRTRTQAALPIVGYAEDAIAANIVDAMRAGALDYLTWPFEARLLKRLFGRVANDDDRFLRLETLRAQARSKVQDLSRREADVLTHLVRGHSNKEIGRLLGISPRTVEIHRANMLGRLGARSTSDAVRIGVHAGLDELPVEEPRLRAIG